MTYESKVSKLNELKSQYKGETDRGRKRWLEAQIRNIDTELKKIDKEAKL